MANQQLTGLEKEAEELIAAFPKEPLVTACLYSMAVSLRRLADAWGSRSPIRMSDEEPF